MKQQVLARGGLVLAAGAWAAAELLAAQQPPAAPSGMAARGAAAMPKPAASGRVFPVAFGDVARGAGLVEPQISGTEPRKYIIEAIGQGVAFLDFDNDGWQDIFLVNGTRLGSGAARPCRLYRNNGARGGFTDVTRAARLDGRTGWGQSVAVADYDNDGRADLLVTYWGGGNALYRNNGDGTFTDMAARAGVAGEAARWNSGASFLDYDRDGRLDLFVASYLELDLKHTPLPGANGSCTWLSLPVLCGPRGLPFSSNRLYRNNGDGRFTDASERSGIAARQNTYALGVIAADLDGDQWQDLYVASDSTRSLFYRNNGDGTFSERAVFTGLAYDDNGLEQAGMGLALGDYDGDGRLDIAKTNFVEDYPNLYRNLGKAGYADRALAAGLGVNPQYVLWSAVFADFDNDTWPDLFFTAGHIFSEVDRLKTAQRFRNPRLLYWNLGNGKFEDVSDRAGAGMADAHASRGGEAGDFDNDGNLDLLIMNMNEPPSLLKNESRAGHRWLKVELRGTQSNRDGIGAVVRVTAGGRTQTMARLSQSGFYSAADPRLHFGLGQAASADVVEVTWPNGLVERWSGVKAGATFRAVEGSGRKAGAE